MVQAPEAGLLLPERTAACLAQAVRRLRAKMDDPFRSKLLHTVRGMGYVLEERA